MSEDFAQSLRQALVRQKWIYGDRFYRMGNPYVWVDGPLTMGHKEFGGTTALAQWVSGYYEWYDTPSEIVTPDHAEKAARIESVFRDIFDFYFPYMETKGNEWDTYIRCTAGARLQDYCMLNTYAKNLPVDDIRHLDFGPGLGVHASYSVKIYKGVYTAIEADATTYNIQRLFFRQLVQGEGRYFDVIDAESMNVPSDRIAQLIADGPFRIKHVPSWYFPDVPARSQDLVTATAVLNELTTASIVWMISHTTRVLKEGGYLYIRDSGKLKPLRHQVNYDEVFQRMGFELVRRLDVRNRIDMYGVPRLYRKVSHKTAEFDELFDELVGRMAVTTHGGAHVYNVGEGKTEKAT